MSKIIMLKASFHGEINHIDQPGFYMRLRDLIEEFGASTDSVISLQESTDVRRRCVTSVKELEELLAEAQDFLASFLPEDWKPKPRIEICHSRDSDGGCDIQVFLDGQRADNVEVATIDPGWGYEFGDYADTLATMIASSTPEVARILYEDAVYALGSRYVEGGPDDDRVAHRYLDWLIYAHEHENAGPSNATPATSPTNCEGVAR